MAKNIFYRFNLNKKYLFYLFWFFLGPGIEKYPKKLVTAYLDKSKYFSAHESCCADSGIRYRRRGLLALHRLARPHKRVPRHGRVILPSLTLSACLSDPAPL